MEITANFIVLISGALIQMGVIVAYFTRIEHRLTKIETTIELILHHDLRVLKDLNPLKVENHV